MATEDPNDSIFNLGNVIKVPTQTDKVVEVELKDLPDDFEEVQALLQGEYAPLKYWIQFAVGYYRLKKYDQFESLLREASAEETIQALQGACFLHFFFESIF